MSLGTCSDHAYQGELYQKGNYVVLAVDQERSPDLSANTICIEGSIQHVTPRSLTKSIFGFGSFDFMSCYVSKIMQLLNIKRYSLAIISGLIVGYMFVNWVEGLNAVAMLLVFVLSICLCEIIWQIVRRPHLVLGACAGFVSIKWLEGLNLWAEILILLSFLAFADLLHQAIRKNLRKQNIQ